MSAVFSYRDEVLYSHHTVDVNPDRESFSMHAHEWMEIYYCISGQGTYLVEGQQYPLEAGDIFIMREFCRELSVDCDGDFATDNFKNTGCYREELGFHLLHFGTA